jgi:hypothetical protein
MIPTMTRRSTIAMLFVMSSLFLVGTADISLADVGRTPVRAALARTDRFASREAKLRNTTYTLGSCVLLHRKPWLGYRCSYTIHGLSDQCHDFVTVAVRSTASNEYNAVAVKWFGSGRGAPC